MQPIAPDLRAKLKEAGLTSQAIEAVWPEWWSDEAEASLSAQAELRFTVARRLGISPSSLFQSGPRFIWRDDARFKNLGNVSETEQAVLASFGLALGRVLIGATSGAPLGEKPSAQDIRRAILGRASTVGLLQLLSFAWALGIPVVRTVVFPLPQKRMHAMSVAHRSRYCVILGQESIFEARYAFTLAHELGHIFLGHLDQASTLLDYEDPLEAAADDEEAAADSFALEILTGTPSPEIRPEIQAFGARQLAEAASAIAEPYGIDPGIIALCVGHQTKRWAAVTGALKRLGSNENLTQQINDVASRQLEWNDLPLGSVAYIEKMLGVAHGD